MTNHVGCDEVAPIIIDSIARGKLQVLVMERVEKTLDSPKRIPSSSSLSPPAILSMLLCIRNYSAPII